MKKKKKSSHISGAYPPRVFEENQATSFPKTDVNTENKLNDPIAIQSDRFKGNSLDEGGDAKKANIDSPKISIPRVASPSPSRSNIAPPAPAPMMMPHARQAIPNSSKTSNNQEVEVEKVKELASTEIKNTTKATNKDVLVIEQSDLQKANENLGDMVNCTAYSPAQVTKGDSFMIKAFVHLQDQATIVDEIIRELNPELFKRAVKPLNFKIEQKQTIQFLLSIEDWIIDEPSQQITWWSQANSVDFWIDVPDILSEKSVLAKLLIFVNNLPAGSLKFKIDIEKEKTINNKKADVEVSNYKFAFLSYASPDREEVLRRAQMLQASKISFFQDVLELEPGQRWEQELYKNIDKCDVFFLFWSNASKDSEWVKREWEYALELQKRNPGQSPDIIPIAIEKPIPVPPTELNYLHFGNAILQILK